MIYSYIKKNNKSKKVAIIYNNRKINYIELGERISELAKKIERHKRNQCVCIYMQNSDNYIIAYLAINMTKSVIVPINVRNTKSEINRILEYCKSDLIVTNNEMYNKLKEIVVENKMQIKIFNVCNDDIYTNNGKASFFYDEELTDVALLLHTSGSLSNPKRVMLKENNLLCCALAIVNHLSITSKDRTLIILPLTLASANTSQMLTHLLVGGTLVIYSDLIFPEIIHQYIEQYNISNITCVPFIIKILANYNVYLANHTLRYICYGGAPTPSAHIQKLFLLFPMTQFIQMYGQTETGTRISHYFHDKNEEYKNSVGKPIPGMEIKLVDQVYNKELKGSIGEIAVCGDNVMKGYYKNLKATKEVIRGKWLLTGDLGYFDEDMNLYIIGRKKNIIIKGGENIYPEEIEEAFLSLNIVEEVIVTKEDDGFLGEIPIAYIVLKPEVNTQIDDIKFQLSKIISRHKIPNKIIFVKEISKTTTGKVVRNVITEKGGGGND